MEYKGYIGHYSFDAAQNIFIGRVANTHHLLTFEGKSLRELRENFEKVISEHTQLCQKYGKELNITHSLEK